MCVFVSKCVSDRDSVYKEKEKENKTKINIRDSEEGKK